MYFKLLYSVSASNGGSMALLIWLLTGCNGVDKSDTSDTGEVSYEVSFTHTTTGEDVTIQAYIWCSPYTLDLTASETLDLDLGESEWVEVGCAEDDVPGVFSSYIELTADIPIIHTNSHTTTGTAELCETWVDMISLLPELECR